MAGEKPSAWATDLANEIVPEGEDLAAMWEAVRVDVARALDAARDPRQDKQAELKALLAEAHAAIAVLRAREDNDPDDFTELLGRIELAAHGGNQ